VAFLTSYWDRACGEKCDGTAEAFRPVELGCWSLGILTCWARSLGTSDSAQRRRGNSPIHGHDIATMSASAQVRGICDNIERAFCLPLACRRHSATPPSDSGLGTMLGAALNFWACSCALACFGLLWPCLCPFSSILFLLL